MHGPAKTRRPLGSLLHPPTAANRRCSSSVRLSTESIKTARRRRHGLSIVVATRLSTPASRPTCRGGRCCSSLLRRLRLNSQVRSKILSQAISCPVCMPATASDSSSSSSNLICDRAPRPFPRGPGARGPRRAGAGLSRPAALRGGLDSPPSGARAGGGHPNPGPREAWPCSY